MHLDSYQAAGDELILGDGRFIGQRTLRVALREGGERTITADRVFVNIGTRATIPAIPGLREAKPMTHVELLDLDRLPDHLVVLGGGYVGLELGQAMRRLGSRVTLIERGPQLASPEDPDFSQAILQLFVDEGIEVLLNSQLLNVKGLSGDQVTLQLNGDFGVRTVEGTDILAAVGRTPNTQGIGLEKAGIELTEKGHIRVNDRLETSAPNVWAIGECKSTNCKRNVSYDENPSRCAWKRGPDRNRPSLSWRGRAGTST